MIDIKHLSKSFGDLNVLKNVSLQLEEGKVLVLIGPSGTGKSTLLRCINYLEKPDDGIITIGDATVDVKKHTKDEVYALRRKTAMVFQNYSLFRHKTALQNIMTPLIDVQGISKSEAAKQAREIFSHPLLSFFNPKLQKFPISTVHCRFRSCRFRLLRTSGVPEPRSFF